MTNNFLQTEIYIKNKSTLFFVKGNGDRKSFKLRPLGKDTKQQILLFKDRQVSTKKVQDS